MIQRAEWRPRADDPRSPLGTYLGRDGWYGVPIGLWIAGYMALVVRVAILLPGDVGLAMLLFALMSFTGRRKEYRKPEAALPNQGTLSRMVASLVPLETTSRLDGVADLVPFPAPDAFFGTEITLRRGEKITGGDLGVVAFSEGWLVYEGLGTAFSLAPSDVQERSVEGVAWTLVLREGQRLTLQSYDAGWARTIRDWVGSPSPIGVSRLPPLERSPIRRLRWAGYFQLTASILGGVGLAAAVRGGVRGTLLFGGLGLVFYLCGVFAAALARNSVGQTGAGGVRKARDPEGLATRDYR